MIVSSLTFSDRVIHFIKVLIRRVMTQKAAFESGDIKKELSEDLTNADPADDIVNENNASKRRLLPEKSGILSNADNSKEAIMKEMTLEKIRERMQVLQSSFLEEIDEKMSEVVKVMLQEMKTSELLVDEQRILFEDSHKYVNRIKTEKTGMLPEKQFIARNSLLTDLFQIKHIKTIYHIFIAILIILFLNTVIYDLVDGGRLNLGFELILWSFGEFRTVVMIWICMMGSTLGLYLAFYLYSTHRAKLSPSQLSTWDHGWLLLLVFYQLLFLWLPVQNLLYYDLPPASSIVVLMEQVRLLMKSHAFVRSNIPRARRFKLKSENNGYDSPCPGFSNFLYFLFIPTLVYRDSYPRTSHVRWGEVAWSLLEVLGVIFYTSFIFDRLLIPDFRRFGQQHLEPKSVVLLVFGSMMPSTLAMLCGFFCLLHSWQNAFAEMTCFADRMFYKDWWNSTSFSAYYRTWNVVVHDWLYTYIYKDLSEYVMPQNRVVPKLMVFAVSALFHEYILTFAFRFFYPVMLLLFGGFGVAFTFVRRRDDAGGNVFMWLALSMGDGLFVSLFSMEWYARINCPPYHDSTLDFFIPRSWTCQPQLSEL